MSTPRILVDREWSVEQPAAEHVDGRGWELLGMGGAALLAVGLADLVLAWIPLALGTPAWEFGTITASLNGLPVPTMGLLLLAASGVAGRRRWLARGTAVTLGVLALAVIAAGVVYATTLPLALRSAEGPVAAMGIRKAIVRSAVQLLVYPGLYIIVAVKAWRRSGAR